MSRVVKVLKTLRNHWKKSTFAAILGYYGINYAKDWHHNYLMMREYSKEALAHGLRPLPAGARNKHITIFLNPAAGNRKSKKNLEKYAEPLLHLAGFLVNTVKTERIDEARDLAVYIEKTNTIVTAGGDGTAFETVTGLLRRDDWDEAVRRYPIGVLPLGKHNEFANRLLYKNRDQPEPKFVAEAAMAVVRHKIKPQDVMEVSVSKEDKKEEEPEENVMKKRKPFYSLAGISIGQFREARKLRDEMPSLFPNYFATFLSLYKTPQQYFKAEVRYVPNCEGCAKCETLREQEKQKQKVETSQVQVNEGPSIWSKIFSIFQPHRVHAQDMDQEDNDQNVTEDGIINPSCGKWESLCVETSELNIRNLGDGKLQIQVNKKLDKTDFMIEGLKRYRNETGGFSQLIDCRETEILPIEGQENMSIDNEEFPMTSFRAKCVRDKVYFFVP